MVRGEVLKLGWQIVRRICCWVWNPELFMSAAKLIHGTKTIYNQIVSSVEIKSLMSTGYTKGRTVQIVKSQAL